MTAIPWLCLEPHFKHQNKLCSPFFVLFLVAITSNTWAKNTIEIVIEEPVYLHYLGVTDDGNNKNQRELTEIRLLLRALHLGGYSGESRFVPLSVEDYRGVKRFLSEGHAAVSATAWGGGAGSPGADLHYSEALIHNFDVGLYTTRQKASNLKIRSINDLEKFSATVKESWPQDVAFLQGLNLKAIYPVKAWRHMLRLVESNRADFLLAAFSGAEDLSREHLGLVLYPVTGVKLLYPGARHWVVSYKHPRGKFIYGVIESGLIQLKESGELQRAYTRAGVINRQVEHWQRLN